MNRNQNFNNISEQQEMTLNREYQPQNFNIESSVPTQIGSRNQKSYELQSKTREQLMRMILGKDVQILKLLETLQVLRRQNLQKTNQAQLWRSKVAQDIKNYNCIQKKFQLSKQKIGLLKQINERLFGQNLELEKNVAKVNKQIIEIKEQMKAQDSANSIKLAEIKAELNQQRKKNKQHIKQITMLKAIIKELEEDLQQENQQDQDGDYGDDYYKQGKKSAKSTDSGEIINDQNNLIIQSCSHQNHHHHRDSHLLPSSLQLKKNQLDQQLQQTDIVFAQA